VQLRRFFGCFSAGKQIEITAGKGVNVPSRLPLDDKRTLCRQAATIRSRTIVRARHAGIAAASDADRLEHSAAVQEQISDLQSMVKDLCKRSKGVGVGDLPEELFRLFTSLIDADVSEELARELVDRLRHEVRGGELSDPLMLQARIARMIEADIRAGRPDLHHAGQSAAWRRSSADRRRQDHDHRQAGGQFPAEGKTPRGPDYRRYVPHRRVEQLRTYADIIELPMEVVSTPKKCVKPWPHVDLDLC